MPNWKRVVVGDAFRLPSRDVNYYRDLFLVWPFLLFSIVGLVNLSTPGHDHRLGIKCAALAVVTILVARERRILFLGAVGFCALQSLISLVITHDWMAFVILLVTGVPFLLFARVWADYKPSYQRLGGLTIVDVIVGLSSLGLTLAAFSWIRR